MTNEAIRDGAIACIAVGTALWNFVASGQLNMILGAVGALLTIAVLLQRLVLNHRRMREGRGRGRQGSSEDTET